MATFHSVQNRRPYQEDVLFTGTIGEIVVYGVADGHGGAEVSRYIGQHALAVMTQENVEQALLQTFATLHDQVAHYTAGACVAIACVTPDAVVVAHLGDCRVVFATGESTVDHTPRNADEAQRIKTAGGYVANARVNGMLAVSGALGDRDYADLLRRVPTVTRYPRTTFCLASDGLDNVYNPASIAALAQALTNGTDAHTLTANALSTANDGDNISVIVVQL